MENTEHTYRQKTPKSAKIFARSQKLHVNGVHHNIRFFEPYPFVTRAASGKFLIDVDSNIYVDYWMGHWSLILGHAAAGVYESVREQLKQGWMYGTVNEQTMELSEKIASAVPVAEKIRYVTSGTEATMYAVRLARTVTGRKIVAKIDGGWHGYTSDLLKTVNWPFSKSESRGLTDEKHIISLPYNDVEGSIEILKKARKDLAAVIIEPMLGGGGCIPARKDYLKAVQDYAKDNGAIFVLDEIVTGFRFRYGCMYATMGLDPDIVTLGKIVGGGFPIGVICAKDEIFKYADTKKFPKEGRAYIGGGTFSANPMSMTAGSRTLEILKRKKSVYSKLESLGRKTRNALTKVFDGKVVVTGMGSLFMTHFVADGTAEVQSAADAARCDTHLLQQFHFEMIAKDGIFFLPGKLGAFSNAHTDDDVKSLTTSAEKFRQSL
ncbi:aspartate aminotransferase family protein [Candidatus Nitrosotenuis uzonensis]|uniref:Glutamate-1-semialdehyde 2,1-aminomutase 2 n=1 Tax=Candidatus Nitrosotenuis uzonensis TaxID=1407055 RepID=A0A812F5S9_9ARCH|nr:aminotransferase class III-fold pyridoxal phosphate-dependent enzyme [Candidatus Nitrosotenuis uzonensis]CAE6498020.1 Glutamate-1-semialdehyde 2,1-aminomutase 2 [Candidatus Nitrosotenuis uzonensis]